MNALRLGLGEAKAEGVHGQRRDAEQLHRRANQTRCDHVVHKECTVVGKKHASAARKQKKQKKGLPATEMFLSRVRILEGLVKTKKRVLTGISPPFHSRS